MDNHRHLEVPTRRFAAVRDDIREAVEQRGYDRSIESYTMAFDRRQPDAALLLLPVQGYADAGSRRMRSTYAYLEEHLCRNGLWYRYPPDMDDGLPGREGAFGICGFWGAEYLARRGDVEEARQSFETLVAHANDVGLFAEEIDPDTGMHLGNFPQAFTHVGLINAAVAIGQAEEAQRKESSRPARESS